MSSESESESSDASRSRRSSYSSESFHSDDNTARNVKKKDVQQNKGNKGAFCIFHVYI